MSPAQPSHGWEQPQTASQSTRCIFCFHCASGCCLLGPSGSPDPSQGSVVSRGRAERSRSAPLESGAGFFLQPQLVGWAFPPHLLVITRPQSTPVQEQLCVTTPRDTYVLALFLRGLEHIHCSELLCSLPIHAFSVDEQKPLEGSCGGRTGGNSWLCQPTPAPLPILQTGKLRPRKEK